MSATRRTHVQHVKNDDTDITVMGRIVGSRSMKNFTFYDLADMSGKIQLIVTGNIRDQNISVGDIVSARGDSTITKSGQLSIQCVETILLSKSNKDVSNALLRKHPVDYNGTSQRSLQLMSNRELHEMVVVRSKLIDVIREHFKANEFMEIDTPVISSNRFAGTAEVFQTRSRTLKKDLYLRGTLEDYLKQLVVAGYERVFQVGECFRNESPALISFTMLEATWAYAQSTDMLDIVQELIFSICNELPTELVSEQRKLELSKKIETRNFWDVLENYFGEDIRKLSSADLLKLAHAEGYQVKDFDDLDFELAKFGYDVIKRKISNNFTTPVFVNRFPACISPLAKEIADGSGEADRGYGFLRGQRLFEVVEEASNYNEQLEKFQSQDDRKPTDEYSFKHDDLLESLSYGCPPMAGLGFNINRVLAVLLDKNRTSDVVAFPITSSALPL